MNATNQTLTNSTQQALQKWSTLRQTMQTNTYILLICLCIFGFAHVKCR